MNELPRVTSILRDFGLIETTFFEPKHSRRGRLVDACCNIIGAGRTITEEWYADHSGEAENDRVEHEDCRPYVEQYRRFLAETGFQMKYCAIEVRNSVARYIGHADQYGDFPMSGGVGDAIPASVELKTGGETDWHKWQSAGYRPALIETLHLPLPPARYVLYLNPDKYKLVHLKDPRDVKEFLTLAAAWWVINGRHRRT